MRDTTARTSLPTDVIVVGASAGGVEALRDFVTGLPVDLTAAVLVVLHMPPGGFSALPAILGRAGKLPVTAAANGVALEPGTIYTAIPDHHLLISRHHVLLSRGPTENSHRPGVDALFRSAAVTWAPRIAGAVLSGSLDDGSAGLALIKSRGGLTAVQDPDEALHSDMPANALRTVAADFVLPAGEIGAALADRLRSRSVRPQPAPTDIDRLEASID
ncbi:chemotaxis protein CheB, partial [Nocardia gipuzkoensis]